MGLDGGAQVQYGTAMSASKHRVYHRLQLASHRLQKAADRAILAAAGITTAQAAVLSVVGSEGSASQRSVARKLGLNESAITAMTTRLLGLGLLDRLPDEADSRAWSLRLSADGRAALKRIEQPFRQINQKIEKALDADEIEALADYVTRISDAFGKP
jgi:MarR family transcriptional regulator, organic hydroperoxide resistance regulator